MVLLDVLITLSISTWAILNCYINVTSHDVNYDPVKFENRILIQEARFNVDRTIRDLLNAEKIVFRMYVSLRI